MAISIMAILAISISIYYDQKRIIRRMEQMISSIQYGDLNISFPSSQIGIEGKLNRSMNNALSNFRLRLYNAMVTETETEAWQKLIRVLTHEIMNSIAPIISLSETVTDRATQQNEIEKEYKVMLQAMQTIHRRSKGLLEFVENYRKLTHIPTPQKHIFFVSDMFNNIKGLLSNETTPISYSIKPLDLRLNADQVMIEQVLINLIKNAIEACQNTDNPQVEVEAFHGSKGQTIIVKDNGGGILPDVLDKIFVPFFTTKPGGSGIGLSICRQIINRHGGNISVVSDKEKGTAFTIQFI